MGMSDGVDGGAVGGAGEPSGGVNESAISAPQSSKAGRGRKLGLGALVVGVLGAAVWFVGPALMTEQCFLDGVEIPCEDAAALTADQCWSDEARTVEAPCEEVPEVALASPSAPEAQCFADEALTVEIPCGPSVEANPFLTGRDTALSGFPESRLDDARALREQIVGSVFAVGPVLLSESQDPATANGTAWSIHPRFAITNQHVIGEIESNPAAVRSSGGTEVTLYLYPDKQSVRGRVVAVDAEQDIAVIELLEAIEVEPLIVAERPSIAGEPVLYVGHPARMQQMWITGLGVVTGYQLPLDRASVLSTLPSHEGASGSPIVDLNGEVVSLLTGGSFSNCSVRNPECIADASVQYASLPVGPTATRGIDGPAIRRFFTQATGETLPPSASAESSAGNIVSVREGSIGSFAVYRDREQASEAGSSTTISGFPVAERATVARLYDRLVDAVFLVETPDGGPIGTAWLVGPTTVVTNEHVSTPARSGDVVTLRRRDGSAVQARIVEESLPDDLTILRLDAPLDTPPLRIAQRNVDVDVPVFYIGHPGWMEQLWITGLGVTVGYDTAYPNRMMTTVPSSGGASGSPIFNLGGEVVAIMSFEISNVPRGGNPVADGSVRFFSVPVGAGAGGADAVTLRSYVERHLG